MIAVKLFEEEYARAEREGDTDRRSIDPEAQVYAAPRDHVSDPKPSKLGGFATFLLVMAEFSIFRGHVSVFCDTPIYTLKIIFNAVVCLSRTW